METLIDYSKKSEEKISTDYFFGLIVSENRKPLPLKALSIEVNLNETLAHITYSQKYVNEGDKLLETEYFFPISNTSCLDGFVARFDGKTIEGRIQQKEKAFKLYQENLANGETVAFAEINEETHDLIKVKIGNIPPKKEIIIEFSFIEPVEVCMSKFRKFSLYSTIIPRYNNTSRKFRVQNIFDYPFAMNNLGTKVSLNLSCQQEITFARSPSHLSAKITQPDSCFVNIQLESTEFNKDFVLLFSSGNLNKPSFSLTPFEEGYCGLVSFFPDLNSLSEDDAYKEYAKSTTQGENLEINSSKGEFIFFLDRSGSMDGTRIKKAKEALVYFLKSLPEDSYFNIVSFGSEYFLLNFDSSLKNTEENIEETLRTLEDYHADLEGTEILEPLQYLSFLPLHEGYPRIGFLLTDGGVNNTDQVINHITQNRDMCRIFTLGVGDGCSTDLIKRAAEAGRGAYEFVGDKEEVSDKIIWLLKTSLSSFASNFKIQFEDPSIVAATIPNLEAFNYIVPNKICEIGVVLGPQLQEKKSTTIKIKYFNGIYRTEKEILVRLNLNKDEENLTQIRYLVHKICNSKDRKDFIYQNPHFQIEDQDSVLKNIAGCTLDLAVNYGVLTNKTAFYCFINQNNDAQKQIPTEKISVSLNPVIEDDESDEDESEKLIGFVGGSLRSHAYNDIPADDIQNKKSKKQKKKKEKAKARMMDLAENKIEAAINYAEYENENKVDYEMAAAPQLKPQISEKDSISGSKKFEVIEESSNHSFNKAKLTDIIMKQKISGYWEATNQIAKLIRVDLSSGLDDIPESISVLEDKNNIWWTILVAVYIEQNFPSMKSSWELIYVKANKWLVKKGINIFDHYDKAKICLSQLRL